MSKAVTKRVERLTHGAGVSREDQMMRYRALLVLSIVAIVIVALQGTAAAQTAPAKVLASVEGRWEQMFCDLTEVSRPAPNELMVRFRYRNAGKRPVQFPLLSNVIPMTVVLDTEKRVVYGALKDTGGQTLSSTTRLDIGSRPLAPGGSQVHWAKLEAPPATTKAITVLPPACMPMEGVTIGGTPTVTPMSAPQKAIVSQDGEQDGVTVEVVELSRAPGAVVNAIVRYRNNGTKAFSFPHLSDQIAKIYLVDPKNRQKYTVALDAERQPIASSSLLLKETSGQAVAPGAAVNFWAKLAAPPENVTTGSLTAYGAPPFDNLTISGSGSGSAGGSAVAGAVIGLEAALKDLGATVSETEIRIALSADVLFDFDKADIKKEAEAELLKVATVLDANANARVSIDGHTDGKGTDAYNNALSERRAAVVKTWLTAHSQMAPARIATRGLGKTKPVAHDSKPDGSDDPDGRAKNRRVEIVVRKTG
jgi:outer membrane protein OmpA-like peptidoglycan-associated protein